MNIKEKEKLKILAETQNLKPNSTEYNQLKGCFQWLKVFYTKMYFNHTKYIPIVFQLQNTNYFCQGHKIQNTLNVFKIHVFQLFVFQLSIHSFISTVHSGYLYSAPSRNLLRGALSPAMVKEKCLKKLAERRHVVSKRCTPTLTTHTMSYMYSSNPILLHDLNATAKIFKLANAMPNKNLEYHNIMVK